MIKATVFNDAACPWGYSANPAFRVLEWRYGDQIEWRLVVIGLRDEVGRAMRERFDPALVTRLTKFRDRYRMPFALAEGARGSHRARLSRGRRCSPSLSRDRVPRPAGIATGELHDRAPARRRRPDSRGAHRARRDRCRRDRRAARRSGGRRCIRTRQGRSPKRSRNGSRSAGQSLDRREGSRSLHRSLGHLRARRTAACRRRLATQLAYDLCIANLDPTAARTPPPETAEPLLSRFPDGLTTAEIAALLAPGPDYVPDHAAAEQQLLTLVANGAALRTQLGDDPLWQAAPGAKPRAVAA